MAKVFSILRRKDGLSGQAFSDYWASTHREHALALARAGFFTGYVQNHLVSAPRNSVWPAADGIPEIWVPSVGTLAEIAASEIYLKGAGQDEPNFTTGDITSYISESSLEVPAALVSSPPPGIRHLVFLKVETPEKLTEVFHWLDRNKKGVASDTFVATKASDDLTLCVVISGFWQAVEPASAALDELTGQLLKFKNVQPLNAGLYEPRAVVIPKSEELL